jgi:hypothetical protein
MLKGLSRERMHSLAPYGGCPLYGPANLHETFKSGKPVWHREPFLVWKILVFKQAIFNLKTGNTLV